MVRKKKEVNRVDGMLDELLARLPDTRGDSGRIGVTQTTEQTVLKQHQPDQLPIHADRGAAMTSKAVALLLAD
jgi:hypothetical protein